MLQVFFNSVRCFICMDPCRDFDVDDESLAGKLAAEAYHYFMQGDS